MTNKQRKIILMKSRSWGASISSAQLFAHAKLVFEYPKNQEKSYPKNRDKRIVKILRKMNYDI